jgi:hypothetical protein
MTFRLFLAAALLFATSAASPETPKETLKETPKLAGAWTLVSSVVDLGGRKIEPYGPDPKGSPVLEPSGRYVAMIVRAGLPKIAAGNPVAGTADENKAIAGGAIAHFGTYTADGKTITFRIEASSFPNWDGVEQKRSFTLTGDAFTYTADGGAAGGIATLTWKRVVR